MASGNTVSASKSHGLREFFNSVKEKGLQVGYQVFLDVEITTDKKYTVAFSTPLPFGSEDKTPNYISNLAKYPKALETVFIVFFSTSSGNYQSTA